MKEITNNLNKSLNSYIERNRKQIDESLVSLRLMKEIDDYLVYNRISHREFAGDIGCSEAYISQLMSGVKKFNTSFINRFEKFYDLKIDFKINSNNNEYIHVVNMANSFMEIKISFGNFIKQSEHTFQNESRPNEFYELTDNY